LGEPLKDADTKFNCVQIAYCKILRYVGIKFEGKAYPIEKAEEEVQSSSDEGYTAITEIKAPLNRHNYTMKPLAGFRPTSNGKIFLKTKGIYLCNVGFWQEGDPTNMDPPSCNRHVALFFADEKWFADGHGTSGLLPHDLNDTNTLQNRTQDMMQTHWSNNLNYKIMKVWEITKVNNNTEKTNDVDNASSVGSQTSTTTANVIDRNGTGMKKCNICNEYKNNKGFSKRQYNRRQALKRVCTSELCQEKLKQMQKLQREQEASSK